MRFVILTGYGPEHRYVTNLLCEAHPIAGIVIDEGVVRGRAARLRRLRRRHGTWRLAERAALRAWGRVGGPKQQRQRASARLLGARGAAIERTDLVTTVQGVNSTAGREVVAGLRPDVLLVYGTGMVSNPVLAEANTIALNLHTGISPHYRGSDCAFWPVHDGRPELLGATVHECTSRVDGGRIFATTRARVAVDDDVESVFVRCVLAGAELYADVLATLPWDDIHRAGTPQELDIGDEYRAASRGLRAELVARRRVRAGLFREYADNAAKIDADPAR